MAAVYVNGQKACSKGFRLKVDNVKPRLLLLRTSRSGGRDVVTLKVSESSTIMMVGRGVKWHRKVLAAHRLFVLRLPVPVGAATMIVSDRAGNKLVRHLRW